MDLMNNPYAWSFLALVQLRLSYLQYIHGWRIKRKRRLHIFIIHIELFKKVRTLCHNYG